jgi:hypothetical protein
MSHRVTEHLASPPGAAVDRNHGGRSDGVQAAEASEALPNLDLTLMRCSAVNIAMLRREIPLDKEDCSNTTGECTGSPLVSHKGYRNQESPTLLRNAHSRCCNCSRARYTGLRSPATEDLPGATPG